MSKLLLIFENTEIESLLNSESNNKSLIIAGNEAIKEKIESLGHTCKLLNSYSKNSKDEIEKSVEWIKNWPDKPIFNGKNFKELLLYGELSIFWFLESRFYYYRISSLIPLIEQIQNMITIEHPSEIIIQGNNDAYHIIKEKYELVIKKITFLGNKNDRKRILYKSYMGNRTLKLFLLKFLRGFNTKKNIIPNRPVLVITEMAYWRKDYDYKEQKTIYKDTIFHGVLQNLKKSDTPFRLIDYENNPKRLLKSNFLKNKRQKAYGVPVESWESYITLDIINKTKIFNRDLEKIWKKIKQSKEFEKSLTYNEIPLYDILKDDIEFLLKSFKSYMSVTFIESAKRILDIVNPSVILLHDEYGTLQLSIIKEAKKRNIPTVSIQHGANTESSISYLHLNEHIQGKSKNLNFPLPDKICVWSEKSKNILKKYGHFPENIPVVTGDPKIDFLPDVIEQFDKENICKNLKIPPQKKIVVFATQPYANSQESVLVANSIFKAIKSLDDVFLVIKVHPNENDLSFYDDIAKKFNVTNYSIHQFYNLYEILFISDVVIVAYSTVGIEAMRMEKPVISINLLGLHDNEPVLKSKIPIIISSESQLISAIKKCCYIEKDEKIITDGKLFAELDIGKVDGKAASRISNILYRLQNQTNV